MSAPNAPRLPALLVLLVLLLSVGAAGQEKAEIHTSTDPAPDPAAALRVAMAARRAESKAEPGRQRQATIETKRNRVAQRQQEAADEMKRVREQVAAEAGSRTIDGSASGGGGVAANPLCASWAEDGECIRNPQYMFKSCPSACASLVYTDLDDDCGGWATAGECEKNPSFMLEQCNASCITHVRKLLTQPRQLNRNEHTLEDLISEVPGARELQRVLIFLPIFLSVVCFGGLGCCISSRYKNTMADAADHAEAAWARLGARATRRSARLGRLHAGCSFAQVGRVLIATYFFNEALTVLQTSPYLASYFLGYLSDGVWQEHVGWVDASNLAGGVAAGLVLGGVGEVPAACVMLFDIGVDAYVIVQRVLFQWAFGRGLYINELMAKKFSMLGCVGMLITVLVQARTLSSRKSFPGLLQASDTVIAADAATTRLSLILLAGRLLIAFLFLYVGLSELHRLLFQPFTPYLPGDGHDVVWPKAVELLLALPFTLGFRMETVTKLLATSLVLEAFYSWAWWRLQGDANAFSQARRAVHYREHFMTNLATAGGLMLLVKLGGGRYTVDELVKKRD